MKVDLEKAIISKWVPDGRCFAGVPLRDEMQYMPPEVEMYYLDRLRLAMHLDPELGMGDYAPAGAGKQIQKIHDNLGLAELQPSHHKHDKIASKNRPVGKVFLTQVGNARFVDQKRIVLSKQFEERIQPLTRRHITFVDPESEDGAAQLIGNAYNDFVSELVHVHAGMLPVRALLILQPLSSPSPLPPAATHCAFAMLAENGDRREQDQGLLGRQGERGWAGEADGADGAGGAPARRGARHRSPPAGPPLG